MREPLTRQQVEVMRGDPYLLATEEALIATIDAERPRADRLEAQCAEMREALIDRRGGRPQCRGCYAYLDADMKHTDTCWAANALASSSGQSLLDVVEAAQRLVDGPGWQTGKNGEKWTANFRALDAALSRWKGTQGEEK